MTTIPVYVYVPVVLMLLGLEMVTVWYAKRRIETLRAALVAKAVLLPLSPMDKRIADALARAAPQTHTLVKGETLTLEGGNFLVQIGVSNPTAVTVKSLEVR